MSGNVSRLCAISPNIAQMKNLAVNAQNCFTNSTGDVCKDCASRFKELLLKYQEERGSTDEDLCIYAIDAVIHVKPQQVAPINLLYFADEPNRAIVVRRS